MRVKGVMRVKEGKGLRKGKRELTSERVNK